MHVKDIYYIKGRGCSATIQIKDHERVHIGDHLRQDTYEWRIVGPVHLQPPPKLELNEIMICLVAIDGAPEKLEPGEAEFINKEERPQNNTTT